LAALSQALVISNEAVKHLAVGEIKSVRAHYDGGEVVQTAKLGKSTGLIATMARTEIKTQMEVERILQVLDVGLNGEPGSAHEQPDGGREEDQIKNAVGGHN
jgi:hypothetical protein